MEDDRAQAVGACLTAQHRRAHVLVERERTGRQRGTASVGLMLQRFFLRATARSMLRGCTEMPSLDCTSRANARACKGPPSRWCCSMSLITSAVSLWAD